MKCGKCKRSRAVFKVGDGWHPLNDVCGLRICNQERLPQAESSWHVEVQGSMY